MDVASSEFHVDGKYDLYKKTRKAGSTEPMLTSKELAEFYKVTIKPNNLPMTCPNNRSPC